MRKLKRHFWSAIYWCYAVWLGIKQAPHTQLGSRVWYAGKTWTVYNGVRPLSWSLTDGSKQVQAPRSECRRVSSFREWWHAFLSQYRWWMTSWHRIYVERRLYPELASWRSDA